MKYPAMALCLFAVIACSRDAEVANVDTTTVSMTSATVDTAATGTTATLDPATATIVDVDRRWGALSDWDADRDKRVARSEFDARRGGLYDRWDRDRNAAVSRDELADTWYDLWDNNNDNFVDEQEWTAPRRHGTSTASTGTAGATGTSTTTAVCSRTSGGTSRGRDRLTASAAVLQPHPHIRKEIHTC